MVFFEVAPLVTPLLTPLVTADIAIAIGIVPFIAASAGIAAPMVIARIDDAAGHCHE